MRLSTRRASRFPKPRWPHSISKPPTSTASGTTPSPQGSRMDDAVILAQALSAEVLRILRPLGIDAAVKALAAQADEVSAAQRQLELALQQARYQAGHARRQYEAVDPANRLVAGELERRWNEALLAVQRIEGEIPAIVARKPPPLGEPERQQLMRLGADLELAWSHPAATAATRKRILRTVLNEIVVRREGAVNNMVLHWKGGDHTALQVKLRLNRGASRISADFYGRKGLFEPIRAILNPLCPSAAEYGVLTWCAIRIARHI